MQDYEAHVQPEALPGRPYPHFPGEVSAQSTGEAIGQGIEHLGAVAQAVHEQAMQTARTAQVSDANNQAQLLVTDLTHNPKTGAFTRQGKDALGLPDKYLPQFDERAAPILDGISDPRAKAAAQQVFAHARTHLIEQLDAHEGAEQQKFYDQTDLSSIKIASQRMADNYNHPDIIASNRETMLMSIDNLAQRKGWSDDQKKEAIQEQLSGAHSDVIDRMLADDKSQMAKHYLDINKDEMDAKSAWSASRTIDAHIKQKQNEQKQDIADRFQDSMQAAQFGLPHAVTVSRGEINVLYPKDAQRHWDMLQMAVEAGAQAKAYDRMTPDAIQADLDARRPTQGGPEAAGQIHAYTMLESAANRSWSARQADPAQFAINSGSGWSALNFKDGQGMLAELRTRANTASQINDQIGVPVSLLTKAEAKTLGQNFAQQGPREQLDILTALRSTMPGDGSYESILHQIAPASPVAAVAGMMVDRPTRAGSPTWYNPQFATDPKVGERILRGEQILNGKGEEKSGTANESGTSKSGFAMPPEVELQTAFNKAIGGTSSNLFQGRSQTAELSYKAFRDYYAAAAEAVGKSTGKYDKDLGREAAAAVIGHQTEYGPSTLTVPAGMDPTRFEGMMDRAVSGALDEAGYNSQEKDKLKGFAVRELGGTLGSGRYAIVNQEGTPLKTPDGREPVIVDLHKQFPRAIGEIERPGMTLQ